MNILHKAAIATSFLATSMAIATPANALSIFDFSYTFDSNAILSGELQGDLQDDGDTVLVSGILSSSYTDTDGSSLDLGEQEVTSAIETNYGISFFGQGAFVTKSGERMDLVACTSIESLINTGECESGFYAISASAANVYEILYSIVGEVPATSFDSTKWLLAEQLNTPDITPVPTPAAILPVLTGLFGAASKRKQEEA